MVEVDGDRAAGPDMAAMAVAEDVTVGATMKAVIADQMNQHTTRILQQPQHSQSLSKL